MLEKCLFCLPQVLPPTIEQRGSSESEGVMTKERYTGNKPYKVSKPVPSVRPTCRTNART